MISFVVGIAVVLCVAIFAAVRHGREHKDEPVARWLAASLDTSLPIHERCARNELLRPHRIDETLSLQVLQKPRSIAAKFVEAAQVYENHLGALQLRAMNIIYETTKERGATILRCETIR
jgi:hypothetical protein